MLRIACRHFFVLFFVLMLLGCRGGEKDGEKNVGKESNAKSQSPQEKETAAGKDADQDQKQQENNQNGSGEGNEKVAEVLAGSWKTTFEVDDAAFEKFVDANMLADDLAASEKARWNESSISIVLNSDGTCIYTEPDGNFYNAAWEISKVDGDRVSVKITGSPEAKVLSIVMDEDGDGFTGEFVDDEQYEFLPIKKPLVFMRE